MSSDPPKQGNCFNCQAVTTDDLYCFGCRVFVCGKCDKVNALDLGPHTPKDHLRSQDDDDDDG